MKKYTLLTFLLSLFALNVQAASVNILGQTLFCPGNNREVQYQLTDNYGVNSWTIGCKSCLIKNPYNNQWYTPETFVILFDTPPNYITIRWDQGNIDDAWIEYIGWKNGGTKRTIKKQVKLVENSRYAPNGEITLSGAGTINCGSTTPLTYTANWKNASSYVWSASGGTFPSGSTSSNSTFTPSADQSIIINVQGYNAACNVYSNEATKWISSRPVIVNEITGPDYVCYGAPSAVSHYVNNIPGVTYTWTATDHSSNTNIITNSGTSNIFVNASQSGPFTLNVKVTGCGTDVIKIKAVNSTNNTPTPPYISQYPGTHCAGSCATYYTQIPTGFVVERQFRYNYGYWDVANSNGSIYICTQSYDAGYRTVELRSKGICGTYSSISSQSINISNCGYMMATSPEDSLALSEMSVENDLALYPNPSTTTMTISLPEDMQETQVTVLSDQGEVVTTFSNTKLMFTFNTGKLVRGNYFLSVADKKKKLTKRFSVEYMSFNIF